MRSISIQSGSITTYFPNTVHFANVPAIVRVVWANDYAGTIPDNVTITASVDGSQVLSEARSVFDRECVFDIRRYLQIVFDGAKLDVVNYSGGMWTRNPNSKKVDVLVTAPGESDNTFTILAEFSIDAVFGNIERGESTGGNIRRRWFVNFPFTLDFYSRRGDSLSVVVDGEDRPGVSFPDNETPAYPATASGYVRNLLNIGELVDPITIENRIRLVQPFAYVSKNDVESAGILAYDLDLDRTPKDAEKRVYLRWIDNQGRFCYWLFKDLGTSDAVSGSSFVAADLRNPLLYEDNLNVGTEVRQSFARAKTRNLGAKSVDRELFDFLLTLVSSPWVDMYDGDDVNGVPQWHTVNVVPATVAKTTKPLQDFKVSIVEPSQITQSL